MEHELDNSNVIRETEDTEEAHDSTAVTLLDPPGGEAATRNNNIISQARGASISSRRSFDYHSEDDYQSLELRLFIRPIIACVWQSMVLVMLIEFIVWTESSPYRVVPGHLATLFVQYPQGATTATTLVGSLLALISTKAFSEAVRFAIVVSLAGRSPNSKNMSLHSLCARISVGLGKTLLDFGRGRVHWTIISLISLLLFTIQTTAWTTTLTPRATDIPYQTFFLDYNYTSLLLSNNVEAVNDLNWALEWASGYAAATEGTNLNMTQSLPLFGRALNGTSRGILPITPTFDNWARIEAVQQGLTAEVNCTATPGSDSNIRMHHTTVARGIFKVALCCNCTSGDADSADNQFVYGIGGYLASTICPISNEDNVITVYMTSSPDGGLNQTCTIRPKWLNVNVTYVHGGLVTLEPTQNLPDISLTSSLLIQSAISTLKNHFAFSQTMVGNHIMDTVGMVVTNMRPESSPESQFMNSLEKIWPITFEACSNVERQQMARFDVYCPDSSCPLPQPFPSTTYVNAIVWGQVPRFRLIVAISPLVIMIATVVIILTSLNNARFLDLDHIASFNAMDTLHIIAACSSGNMDTVSFPDYRKNIGLFSKDVDVEFTETDAESGAAGFRLSTR